MRINTTKGYAINLKGTIALCVDLPISNMSECPKVENKKRTC